MNALVKSFVMDFIEKKGPLPADVDLDQFDYMDSGHVDSMRLLKFIIELETEFDVDIEEDEIEDPAFRTVGGLVETVTAKL